MIGNVFGGYLQQRAAQQMAEIQRQRSIENQQAAAIEAMRLRVVARKYSDVKRVWYNPETDCYCILRSDDSIDMEPAPRKRNPVPTAFARMTACT